jgi:DNA mismatch repair protein MutS2
VDPDGHARRVLEFDKLVQRLAEGARTPGGRRRLQQWTPSGDVDEVRRRQKRCSELLLVVQAGAAPPDLSQVIDYRNAVQVGRRSQEALAATELRGIADTLHTASRVQGWLHTHQADLEQVRTHVGEWPDASDLVRAIHKAIRDNGDIDDAASPRLRDVRERQTRVRKQLVSRLEKIAASRPADEESWVTLRGERYVIPVRADAASSVPGIVHDRSASGVTLFVEPLEVVEANNELQGLQDAEVRECHRILQELTAGVREHRDTALLALTGLERLDALCAVVAWSREEDAVSPGIGAVIRLRQGRHPLLARQLREVHQALVPLDIELATGESLVITGPNTGGKTVALKCLGLLVLMHQSGVPIPAHIDSTLPILRRVFADIGDEQSIESAQSTFSSHLRHVGEAVRFAESDCLVLLDEFMSGTDPQEGAALGAAILRRFVRCGAQALVTTHLGELKLFAHAEPGVTNAAMLFDPDSRTPLYRLQAGIPGASNALNIAARLGLPEDLLQEARDRRGAASGALEDAIAALEAERRQLHAERAALRTREEDSRRLQEELHARLDELQSHRKQTLGEARREASDLVRGAQSTIENLVRELRETQASRETIHKAQRTLESMRQRTHTEPEEAPETTEDRLPRVGDTVYVQTLQRQATVEALDRGDRLRVRFGNVQMQVEAADVRVVSAASEPTGRTGRRRAKPHLDRPRGGHDIRADESVSLRLDVRGLSLEEALQALDRFLDRAVLQGAPVVQIVHGKGTGVLRAGIGTSLGEHPRVASFRLGEHGEGGSGVTIVHLD